MANAKAVANDKVFKNADVVTPIAPAKEAPAGNPDLAVNKDAVAAAGVKLVGTFKIVEGTAVVPTGNNVGAPEAGADVTKLQINMKGK